MKTLGDILRKARSRKKITLMQAAEQTRIHPKYLKALETNNYKTFSGKVHSKGFLKIYAGFLKLNVSDVLALWRREYEKDLEAGEKKRTYKVQELDKVKLVITPSTIIISFVAISIVLFFSYLFYQYRSFTGAPALEVYHPEENMVSARDILDITGKTDLDSQVYINNQEIIPGPDGSFAQSIKLKEGLNTLSISAVNKLSKRSEVVRTIIYRPQDREDAVVETTESSAEVGENAVDIGSTNPAPVPGESGI